MHKLIEFIRSVYVVVLFVVLEALAVSYYAHSTNYTQARLMARSTRLVGGVHGFFAGIGHYFSLGRENRLLLDRTTTTTSTARTKTGHAPTAKAATRHSS